MPALIIAIVVLLAIWIARTALTARKNRSLIEQLIERVSALETESRPPAPRALPVRMDDVRAPEPEPPLVARAEAMMPPETPLLAAPRKSAGFEETLGTNWLNKVGIIILVIGIAFFLAYELSELGPLGKVVVGYALSAAMLSLGIWFERREQWRVLARAGLSGAWALLYFTTYAMHHVPAARILPSESLDLILLLLVAASMVAHTLRYDSQLVTALAFLLAFTTINISRGNVYSLMAGAILAAGLAAVALRRRWFEAEAAGIIAVYVNHYLWLRPIVESGGLQKLAFSEYLPSSVLLLTYWLIFRSSYVLRTVRNARDERTSTCAALLNTGLLLWVLRYQSIRPELGFQVLILIGAAEVIFGQLPITRRRRAAFVVLNSLGVCLLILAIPNRYSGHELLIVWLAEAQALIMAGIFAREVLYYRLGVIAALVTAFATFIQGMFLDLPAHAGSTVTAALAALFFYVDSQYVPRRLPRMVEPNFDRAATVLLAHASGALALAALWLTWTGSWTAVAWAVLTVVLTAMAAKLESRELALQAPICAIAVAILASLVNLDDTTTYGNHWLTARRLTLPIVILLLYVAARCSRMRARRLVPYFSALFLLTALLAVELPGGLVTLGWGIEAVGVFLLALWSRERIYRFSALGLLCLCVLKIVVHDVWGIAPRDRYLTLIVLGLVLLAVSYLYTRFSDVLRQYL